MQLTINGHSKHFADSMTIEDMVKEVGADVTQIAVEQNRVIIPRSQFAATQLRDGDTIELVEFVGGG